MLSVSLFTWHPPVPDNQGSTTGSDWSTRVNHNIIVYQCRACTHVTLCCTGALYTCSHTVHNSIVYQCRACTHVPLCCTGALYTCSHMVSSNQSRWVADPYLQPLETLQMARTGGSRAQAEM